MHRNCEMDTSAAMAVARSGVIKFSDESSTTSWVPDLGSKGEGGGLTNETEEKVVVGLQKGEEKQDKYIVAWYFGLGLRFVFSNLFPLTPPFCRLTLLHHVPLTNSSSHQYTTPVHLLLSFHSLPFPPSAPAFEAPPTHPYIPHVPFLPPLPPSCPPSSHHPKPPAAQCSP